MWNNAGSFLAPKQVILRAPVIDSNNSNYIDWDSSSSGDEEPDFTVTAPVATPCVLNIVRRDAFWGVEKAPEDETSFFNEQTPQVPRLIHKVNRMYGIYAYSHAFIHAMHPYMHNSYSSFGRITSKEYSMLRIRICGGCFAQFGLNRGCAKLRFCAQLARWSIHYVCRNGRKTDVAWTV